ncbi:hypothetical protein ACFT5B_14280 [Luteimicrobium sp. NPDC057192]|uniref:hypothetical protein n=1 Tax=Luteimicrobium sp. NPDC057192 TaxID=3346042 RepID=UPI00363855A7
MFEYWIRDLTGDHRDTLVRAEYDDDAVAAIKGHLRSGEIGPFRGEISLVRSDGEIIETWDGPDQVFYLEEKGTPGA